MFEFIRTNQLNIMLGLSSICLSMAGLLLITKFLTRRRKLILFLMEVFAALLLLSDRTAYIYSGNLDHKAYVMVRVSNFLVFFLTVSIVFEFNGYLIDLLMTEGKLESVPRRLQVVGLISVVGMLLSIVAAFTGLYYYFDENNVYHRGPLFLISYIIPVIGPIIQYTVIRQYKKKFSPLIYTALVLYLFVPIVCGIIQIFAYGISIVNMAMVLVSIFLYIFTYLDVNEAAQRSHELEMEKLKEDRKAMKRLFDQIATALVAALEKKDAFSQGHTAKAAEMAGRIAKSIGKDQEEIDEIYFAALLHNVGVMGIPDGILENLDKLSPEQYEVYKQTPLISAEILSNITEYPFLSVAAKYAHERYDGTGYPEGLSGDGIPEIARIMAVVDAYDSMATKTKYRDPLPEPIIREEFIKQAGNSLDPEFAKMMVDVLDQGVDDEDIQKAQEIHEVEKELVCKEYRESITSGITIENTSTSISFFCEPQKTKDGDFSQPSIIIFDSYDRRVHGNAKAIDAYNYTEYGEVWFDGHSISTDARNMEVIVEDITEDDNSWEAGKHIILASRYEDHVKIAMTDGKKDIEVILALPDSSKFAAVAITGEHCLIKDIVVERTEDETKESDIERIAEVVSYIQRMESDLPNVQIDSHRSAYSESIEIEGVKKIAFHTMSLPAANLVWHCPYIVLFYSEDGKVGGQGYKEYALIKINGEIDKNGLYAHNSFSMKRLDSFPGWNEWKEANKKGLECEIILSRKGDTVTFRSIILGVEIQNTTVINENEGKVYAAITGDIVAITDIRIK